MKKRLMSVLLCTAAIVLSLPSYAIAETDNTSTTTTTESSHDETTTTSKHANYEFQCSVNGNQILVSWNSSEHPGVEVKSVELNDENYIVNDATGTFVVPNKKPGIYTVTYLMSDGKSITQSGHVEIGGTLTLSMSVQISNGRIEAALKDNYERPVSSYPIRLFIDGTETAGGNTNAKGIFSSAAPSHYSEILCVADTRSVGSVNYTGCQDKLTNSQSTTGRQTTSSPTSTDSSSVSPSSPKTQSQDDSDTKKTNAPTYSVINGAGTTSIVDDFIACNVSFDTQITKNFDYSSTEFASRSKLLVNKTTYSQLVGNSNTSLMLLAKTPGISVTPQFISSAINGKSNYSSFNPEETEIVPLDLSLLLINTNKNVSTPISNPMAEITIELPIPKSMSDSSKFKIVAAIYDENGIKSLLNTDTKDGSIRFTTNQLSTIAILGFKSPVALNKKSGGLPIQSIILILVGVLLLGGAIILLYFFFIRQSHTSDETEYIDEESYRYPNMDDAEMEMNTDTNVNPHSNSSPLYKKPQSYPEDNGIDIYSGSEKMPNKNRRDSSFDDTVSLGFIDDTSGKKKKTKNPSDYDIDL